MPRRTRHVTETPATKALDAAVAAYDRAEKRLHDAIIAAAREAAAPASDLTYAEIARRTGYSREHVSRLASDAGIKRPPKDGTDS